MKDAGYNKRFSYFEIDASLLDRNKSVVYLNLKKEDKNDLREEDFVPFDPSEVERWAYIPKDTIDYYHRKQSEGKEPTIFLFIPHILYKGNIDVGGLELKVTS